MVDDCRGVEMAVEHLVKTGRRNLYYIKDKSTDSAAAKAKGFLSGMAAAGLDADGHVLETGETLEDGIRVVQQLLAEGIRPDGILCGEDLTAAGVLKALLRAGIRVPEETAVVGYDNSTYARLCEPELTSVDNKPEQVLALRPAAAEPHRARRGLFFCHLAAGTRSEAEQLKCKILGVCVFLKMLSGYTNFAKALDFLLFVML